MRWAAAQRVFALVLVSFLCGKLLLLLEQEQIVFESKFTQPSICSLLAGLSYRLRLPPRYSLHY